jgi:hypothetical protein
MLNVVKSRNLESESTPTVYSSWYLGLLESRVSKFADSPLVSSVLPLLLPGRAYPTPKSIKQEVINKSLRIVAIELCSGSASIDSIAQKLHNKFTCESETIIRSRTKLKSELHQFVFRAVSLLTLIYDAEENPKKDTFQLALSEASASALSRHQKSFIWERLECEISNTRGGTVHIDLDQLFSHFGNFSPPQCLPPANSRRDLYEDSIVASNVNFDTLSKIGQLSIEWVESLSLHLELHERSSKLRLFAYPSFCALLCEHYQTQKTFLSK